MSANTIPDDVMRAASDAYDSLLTVWRDDLLEISEERGTRLISEDKAYIANVILAEREAQKARDAKIAATFFDARHDALARAHGANIAAAILNPPSAASSRAEQTGEAQSLPASPVPQSDADSVGAASSLAAHEADKAAATNLTHEEAQ